MRRERRPAIRDFDADAIRAAITLLGLTDTALASETGLSVRTLGAWARGEVVPTTGKVQKLIDYMGRRGISVDDAIRAAHGDTSPQVDLVEQAILNDEQLPMRLREQLVRQRRAMLGDDSQPV